MAMNPCKSCGQPISIKAASCPACGHPVVKKTSVLTWIVGFVLVLGGSVAAFGPRGTDTTNQPAAATPQTKPAKVSKDPARDAQLQYAGLGAINLKKASKDPDSFEMKSVLVMPSGAACYEYRAKNSFNALLAGSAVLTSKKKMLVQERDGNAFVRAWNSECTKEGGDELLPLLKRLEII